MSIKDELMNGSSGAAEAIASPPAPAANPQLVEMTRRLLADVEAGKITSLACLIVTGFGQVQWPAYGMQMADLYVAASLFQRSLEAAMTGQNKGRILRG